MYWPLFSVSVWSLLSRHRAQMSMNNAPPCRFRATAIVVISVAFANLELAAGLKLTRFLPSALTRRTSRRVTALAGGGPPSLLWETGTTRKYTFSLSSHSAGPDQAKYPPWEIVAV